MEICHGNELALQHAKTVRDTDGATVSTQSHNPRTAHPKWQKDKVTFKSDCKRCGTRNCLGKQGPTYGKSATGLKDKITLQSNASPKVNHAKVNMYRLLKKTALCYTFFDGMVTQEEFNYRDGGDECKQCGSR